LLKGAPYRAGTFQRLARLRFTALVCSGPTLNIIIVCHGNSFINNDHVHCTLFCMEAINTYCYEFEMYFGRVQ
jgi:hypothetical protein